MIAEHSELYNIIHINFIIISLINYLCTIIIIIVSYNNNNVQFKLKYFIIST